MVKFYSHTPAHLRTSRGRHSTGKKTCSARGRGCGWAALPRRDHTPERQAPAHASRRACPPAPRMRSVRSQRLVPAPDDHMRDETSAKSCRLTRMSPPFPTLTVLLPGSHDRIPFLCAVRETGACGYNRVLDRHMRLDVAPVPTDQVRCAFGLPLAGLPTAKPPAACYAAPRL